MRSSASLISRPMAAIAVKVKRKASVPYSCMTSRGSITFPFHLVFFVAHQCVNVNITKRDIIHELEPHHNHPCHPEEQNIETGDQGGGRVEALEIVRLMRPAKG